MDDDLPGKGNLGPQESRKPPSLPVRGEYAARDRASGSHVSEPAGQQVVRPGTVPAGRSRGTRLPPHVLPSSQDQAICSPKLTPSSAIFSKTHQLATSRK